MNISDEIKNK